MILSTLAYTLNATVNGFAPSNGYDHFYNMHLRLKTFSQPVAIIYHFDSEQASAHRVPVGPKAEADVWRGGLPAQALLQEQVGVLPAQALLQEQVGVLSA